MSWRVGIKTAGDIDWVSNQLRFKSIDEAKRYSVDLDWRWTVKKEMKILQSDDPVNAAWRDGRVIHLDYDDEGFDAAHG